MDYSLWNIIIFLNAFFGWLYLEWAWAKFRRFRKPNRDLDAIYPAYTRHDCDKWQKWKLYPGALTIAGPRALFGVLACISLLLWLNICMLGVEKGGPILGIRRKFLQFIYRVHAHLISLGAFFCLSSYQYVGKDQVGNYEQYLGSQQEQDDCQNSRVNDSRVPKRGPGNVSAIVCNHTGWLEIFALITSPVQPGFTPRIETKEVPVLNKLTEGLQSLYICRGGTLEERNKIVQTIVDRQRTIEDQCIDYPPFAVFAEATTTNGSCLFPFKRGAFTGMRTVTPTYVTVEAGQIKPFYDTCEMIPLFVLLFCSFNTSSVTLNIMPDFTPNTVMLEKHADKGEEPWEVYAWCVRDAISQTSGLKKQNNVNFKDKIAYIDFMNCYTDHMEVDGRMFRINGTYDSNTFEKLV